MQTFTVLIYEAIEEKGADDKLVRVDMAGLSERKAKDRADFMNFQVYGHTMPLQGVDFILKEGQPFYALFHAEGPGRALRGSCGDTWR